MYLITHVIAAALTTEHMILTGTNSPYVEVSTTVI